MRNNQLVTDEEYIIPKDVTLVTKTDLQGNITEVNDAFEIASGFSKEELLGSPHNIVRHPDVPAAVFKDLWQTIKAGGTWSQIVKNKRKDGGFYWVTANVTPVFVKGKVTGYLSFRTYCSDANKVAASKAYQQIAAKKLKIENGKIINGFQFSRLNPLRKLSPPNQTLVVMFFLGVIPLAIFKTLNQAPIWEIILISLLFIIPSYLIVRKTYLTSKKINQDLLKISNYEKIDLTAGDNKTHTGRILNSLIAAAISTRYSQEKSLEQLDKAQQLEDAINLSSANLMTVNNSLEVNFVSKNLIQLLTEIQPSIQSSLPAFSPKKLCGENITLFHELLKNQHQTLLDLDDTLKTNLQFGNTYIELIINPIYNRNNQRIGLLIEWQDITQDIVLVENIGKSVELAALGIFDQKIDTSILFGSALKVAKQINKLIDAIEYPINQAVAISIEMAKGNLSDKITGEMHGRFDLLKTAINVAIENTSSLINQTTQTIKRVQIGASDIEDSSINLNDRTQEQAASLEETAASMEQITSAIQQNSDNVQQATQATHKTAKKAHDSVEIMEQAIQSMEQIHQSSQKINDIISLIDSIAFQTNLLALNAAVEAARAGDHGRGFAVVAGEVRTLAGKSADAAKEIRGLIEDTVSKVAEGSVQVKNSGNSLSEIVEGINNTNQIIEEIASSSKEQSQGVSQVNQAITNIDGAVQQNAALVENSTTTAQSLKSLSEKMFTTIQAFKTTGSSNSLTKDTSETSVDFDSVRRAHNYWRVNVQAYLNNVELEFPRDTASDGTKCILGQWIYSEEGKSFAHLKSYQILEKGHLALHNFIGNILNLKDAGKEKEAILEADKLEELSAKTIALINDLEVEIYEKNSGDQATAPKPTTTIKTSPKTTTKAVIKQIATTTAPRTIAKVTSKPTAESSNLQTPAPSQPKLGQGDEWGEF